MVAASSSEIDNRTMCLLPVVLMRDGSQWPCGRYFSSHNVPVPQKKRQFLNLLKTSAI